MNSKCRNARMISVFKHSNGESHESVKAQGNSHLLLERYLAEDVEGASIVTRQTIVHIVKVECIKIKIMLLWRMERRYWNVRCAQLDTLL